MHPKIISLLFLPQCQSRHPPVVITPTCLGQLHRLGNLVQECCEILHTTLFWVLLVTATYWVSINASLIHYGFISLRLWIVQCDCIVKSLDQVSMYAQNVGPWQGMSSKQFYLHHIKKHELLEMRWVAAYIYMKAGRWKQSVALSKKDNLYKDVMETCFQSWWW